jgi:hypothetical protein
MLRVAQGHAQYSPLIQTCDVTGTNLYKWPVMMAFITDISLLSIVIGGLLYKRAETHLWNMLYFQGLFWIVASFVVGMPDTVCRSFPHSLVRRFDSTISLS